MSYPSTQYINDVVVEMKGKEWVSKTDVMRALKIARGEGALTGEIPPGVKKNLGIPRKPYTMTNRQRGSVQ